MKTHDVLALFKGKFVTGTFTKKNGEVRTFWGQLENDVRHPRSVTYFDYHKHGFRRMSLDQGVVTIKSGETVLTVSK